MRVCGFKVFSQLAQKMCALVRIPRLTRVIGGELSRAEGDAN